MKIYCPKSVAKIADSMLIQCLINSKKKPALILSKSIGFDRKFSTFGSAFDFRTPNFFREDEDDNTYILLFPIGFIFRRLNSSTNCHPFITGIARSRKMQSGNRSYPLDFKLINRSIASAPFLKDSMIGWSSVSLISK